MTIANLKHPGIVRIHEVFEENETGYYVADYIKGDNLSQIINKNGPLTECKAKEILIKICEAIEYIHSKK